MANCIDCKKVKVSRKETLRCKPCFSKYYTVIAKKRKISQGKSNPNYKDGRSLKKYFCKKCNKKITYNSAIYGSGYCRSCSVKVSLNKIWDKKGRLPFPKCLDCKKILTNKQSKRCNKCFRIRHSKIMKKIWKTSLYKLKNCRIGRKNGRWINGKTSVRKTIRSLDRYTDWRFKILKRDDFKCTNCGYRGYLEVDHIYKLAFLLDDFFKTFRDKRKIRNRKFLINKMKKYKPFWNIKNGRTLCLKCHQKTDTYMTKKGIGKINGKT